MGQTYKIELRATKGDGYTMKPKVRFPPVAMLPTRSALCGHPLGGYRYGAASPKRPFKVSCSMAPQAENSRARRSSNSMQQHDLFCYL